MMLIDPGVDLPGFIHAVITWMGPTFSVVVGMAVALELIWISAKWSKLIGGK